ncbi:S1/P1 nuclease [Massilia sp. MS-15]|uniref:S1/P1 nuclease n=1 Tax=Massilia sp. MS-15 TaxID=2878200 RepID=UPI001CD7E6C3|nr:S1/P1 nuclease [Massilia sp. MS-15]MCA1248481.1 S1/P1 nuclease [Massilia sp. MS-15]
MKKLACVLALTSAFASFDAAAWGRDGHKAVGAIADRLLKGSYAQKQIQALLLPGETLESIANWADCVKGSYCGPQTQEMLDYVKANPEHDKYHYTNVPFQHDHYDNHGPGRTGVDIVQTLRQCIAVLQGKTDPALNPHKFTKRQALILLTHFAGDIHQPLHVGAAFVGRDGKFVAPSAQEQIDERAIFDTRGSNSLLLDVPRLSVLEAASIPPGEPVPVREGVPQALTKPFHSYWDSTTVDYAFRRLQARTPQQFADKVIAGKHVLPLIEGDPITAPYAWANHSLYVAKQAFEGVSAGALIQQTGKKGETYYSFALEVPQNYPVPSSELAKQQLIKGGYNLAAILQAIFPDKA